jgi:hypothetical protein
MSSTGLLTVGGKLQADTGVSGAMAAPAWGFRRNRWAPTAGAGCRRRGDQRRIWPAIEARDDTIADTEVGGLHGGPTRKARAAALYLGEVASV